MKTCAKCGEAKPLDEFHRRSDRKNGHVSRCKSCVSATSSERYAATISDARRIELAARKAAWIASLSDSERDEIRRKNREYMRRYAEANRARINSQQRSNREADPGRFRDYSRKWAELNADKKAEWDRLYREANPATRSEAARRRRARKRGTQVEVVDLDALWTGRCGLCLEAMDRSLTWPNQMSPSVDHIVPLAKGGTHTADNLQWAHWICNVRKGDRLAQSA